MNIFFLFLSAVESAQALCDKHVVKMPLEMAQLLCTAYRSLYGQRPKTKQYLKEATTAAEQVPHNDQLYKLTHYNHPMTVWVRSSLENFKWTLEHGNALCEEWRTRYHHTGPDGKQHACMRIFTFMQQHMHEFADRFPQVELTVPPQCVNKDEYRNSNPDVTMADVVQVYRRFYVAEKMSQEWCVWTKSPKRKPQFIVEEQRASKRCRT